MNRDNNGLLIGLKRGDHFTIGDDIEVTLLKRKPNSGGTTLHFRIVAPKEMKITRHHTRRENENPKCNREEN